MSGFTHSGAIYRDAHQIYGAGSLVILFIESLYHPQQSLPFLRREL